MAHFYFAEPEPDLIVGGLLGEYVKGPLQGQYPAGLEQGVRLHRFIDSATDRHPSQSIVREILPKELGRYSSIINDMLCDHFLACSWAEFHSTNLTEFTETCMNHLNASAHMLPEKGKRTLQRMQTERWTEQYLDIDNIYRALVNIGKRFRRTNPMHRAPELIPPVIQQIEPLSRQILGDTLDAVRKWRTDNTLDHPQ